jgi:hypothetical protein
VFLEKKLTEGNPFVHEPQVKVHSGLVTLPDGGAKLVTGLRQHRQQLEEKKATVQGRLFGYMDACGTWQGPFSAVHLQSLLRAGVLAPETEVEHPSLGRMTAEEAAAMPEPAAAAVLRELEEGCSPEGVAAGSGDRGGVGKYGGENQPKEADMELDDQTGANPNQLVFWPPPLPPRLLQQQPVPWSTDHTQAVGRNGLETAASCIACGSEKIPAMDVHLLGWPRMGEGWQQAQYQHHYHHHHQQHTLPPHPALQTDLLLGNALQLISMVNTTAEMVQRVQQQHGQPRLEQQLQQQGAIPISQPQWTPPFTQNARPGM